MDPNITALLERAHALEGAEPAGQQQTAGPGQAWVPAAAQAVYIRQTMGRGRELTASSALPDGTVVVEERPALSTLAKRDWRTRCQACMAPFQVRGTPAA